MKAIRVPRLTLAATLVVVGLHLGAFLPADCGVSAVSAARADQPFVDPYSVASPDGRWTISIVPSSAEGAGRAKYLMRENGAAAYDVELAYTLRECVVSDAGMVVGYAYDNGYMGWNGNIVVLVIGPDGSALTTEVHSRNGPALPMDPPPPGEPRGEGVMLDQAGQRAIVRISRHEGIGDESPAQWWIYGLSDGKPQGVQTPKAPHEGQYSFSREVDARLIGDTGLIAVHWFVYEESRQSAVFELIDRAGEIVWSLRIDGEYANMPRDWQWWDLADRGVRQIETRGDGSFAVVSYLEGKRTTYTLAHDADAWSVREVGTEVATPSENPGPVRPVIEQGELKLLREVAIAAPPSTDVIEGIYSLSMDDRGRIGWVRWVEEVESAARFTLVDRDGQTVADIPLGLAVSERAQLPQAVWLNGDRWIVAQTEYGEDRASVSRAWFLDITTKELQAIADFSAGSIERICRTPDGGFIVLGRLHGNYTIRDQVARYDKEGKVSSSTTEPGYGQGESIQDIAVLSDGSVAMLTGVADDGAIEVMRPGQSEPQVWQVAAVLGDAKAPGMGYYADIRADKDGGLVLYDSAHENLLHRVNREGVCWQSFHARGPKGEPFRLYDPFAVDPDGRVWVSDGSRLYRLGEDGKADTALGGAPEGSMSEPAAVTLDKRGWIYALEKGTAYVHVFDELGKPMKVLKPEPGDTPTQSALAWITVEEDGGVTYQMNYDGNIVLFGPDGERIGVERPKEPWDPEVLGRWEAVHGGGWEANGGSLRRVAPDGTPGRQIDHRPDGAWIVKVLDAQAAPDGTLVVLCSRPTPQSWSSERQAWLCVYGAEGEGLGTLPIEVSPSGAGLRVDTGRAIVCDPGGLTSFAVPLTAKGTRFDLSGGVRAWYNIMQRPDGTLATWSHGARVVQFWELPER
jgi:hypothetical protein